MAAEEPPRVPVRLRWVSAASDLDVSGGWLPPPLPLLVRRPAAACAAAEASGASGLSVTRDAVEADDCACTTRRDGPLVEGVGALGSWAGGEAELTRSPTAPVDRRDESLRSSSAVLAVSGPLDSERSVLRPRIFFVGGPMRVPARTLIDSQCRGCTHETQVR